MVNFSLVKSNNGQVNVFLNGQSPLVVGDHKFPITADFSAPQTVIRDSQGNDITAQITSGKLGALLREKNSLLPGHTNTLNELAQTFADQVNQQLSQGVDQNGLTSALNLFTYHQPWDAAATIAVTGIAPDQIAAASPTAPGGNANAIAVVQLASAPLVGGFTFTQSYGGLSGQVGRDVARAQQDQAQNQDLLTQAQQLRSQETGVSLDEEAAKLIQVQQAYQAIGKLVTVLSDLTQALMGIIPPA